MSLVHSAQVTLSGELVICMASDQRTPKPANDAFFSPVDFSIRIGEKPAPD